MMMLTDEFSVTSRLEKGVSSVIDMSKTWKMVKAAENEDNCSDLKLLIT